MPIQILKETVASQIAAGEVVERPASVVKELLENSLDAGADRIHIDIRQAGKQLIEVADNGSGIASQEVPLALTRHATSKLQNAEQLLSIRTLGFRGEALASIASVSRTVVTTRTSDEEAGSRLVMEGGQSEAVQTIAFTQGTTVRVENLFSQVPARLKFLKSDTTERQQIYTLVSRYALGYPGVRFTLLDDGKTVLQTSGNENRREVLNSIYGIEIARAMLEVVFQEEDLKIGGFTSPLTVSRSNRKEMTFFVNGRWVHDTALNTALQQAYAGMLMVGRFPMAALFIQMPPDRIDVNVHPAKSEVRFRDSHAIFSAIQRAVRRAVMAYSPLPEIQPARVWGNRSSESAHRVGLDWQLAAETAAVPAQPETSPVLQAPIHSDFVSASIHNLPLLRLIGQIGGTYLVAEGPDGLYLIDQHAAHERVLFEKLMNQKQELVIQPLLQPMTIDLAPHQAVILREATDTLTEMGFLLEEFGSHSFRVRGIPAIFQKMNPEHLIRAVVEDSEEDETPLQSMMEAKIASRVCKRAAVKGGTQLSAEEQGQLLRDLEICRSPRTCPHGRPTMIHLSVDVLERHFGRRGSRQG